MLIKILISVLLVLVNCFLFKINVLAQEENVSQPIPGQFIVEFNDAQGNA